jgi:hypothetical protein
VVVLLLTITLLLQLGHLCSARKNRDIAHPHRGVLNPYEAGPFSSLDLNAGDEKELTDGKPVMKQNRGDDLAGGAICIQDVDAPKEAVWAQILDLDAYKGKVPKVNECKNYEVKENPDGTCTMKTKMVVGVIPGYAVRFCFIVGHAHGCRHDSVHHSSTMLSIRCIDVDNHVENFSPVLFRSNYPRLSPLSDFCCCLYLLIVAVHVVL